MGRLTAIILALITAGIVFYLLLQATRMIIAAIVSVTLAAILGVVFWRLGAKATRG